MPLVSLPFPASQPVASLEIELAPEINYALCRGGLPFVQRLAVRNTSSEPVRDIAISISCPALLPLEIKADAVAAGEELDLTAHACALPRAETLLELTEAADMTMEIVVARGGEEALRSQVQVKATPYDQWMGARVRPEVLAEFVTPNHPLVSRVLARASGILRDIAGTDAFDGYQSGSPTLARAQMAAIYQALRQEGISYVVSPPSFEITGQRVRMVPKVLSEKLGNCLDLSLLYASCLEAAGMNPVITLTLGHCMAGAWLTDDFCVQAVSDDPDYLLKSALAGVNDLAVVDAVNIAQTVPVSFEQAAASALAELSKEDNFECYIDVVRARYGGVRPMPLPVRLADGTWEIENDGTPRDEGPATVRVMDRYDLSEIDLDNPEVTKFTIWERKLLDFSLRNSLLNMRPSRRSIPLLAFGIDKIEDILRQGTAINVFPFPQADRPEPSDYGHYATQPLAAELETFAVESLKTNSIYSFLDEEHLVDAARLVYRAAQTSLEESGANSLFLALGILQWRETESAPDPRRAPILLVPIDISRVRGSEGLKIRARGEDSIINITLVELLRQQHDIDLSALMQLPADESGADVRRILATVAEAVRHKRGWRVEEEAVIGIFSFSKFVMWADIHSHAEQLLAHPLVQSLVESRLSYDINASLDGTAAERIEEKPQDFAIPIDVDSSQLEAIVASGQGQSFVLHGPPGTGKSQTITNIIANALYQGRRVLFVAEKRAALEVVHQRLQSIGLAPFCLELHSNKVTKQHFLAQMEKALDAPRGTDAPAYEQMARKVAAQASQLSAYVAALHCVRPCGLSLYECIERYMAIDGPAEEYTPEQAARLTAESVEEGRHALIALAPLAKTVGPTASHPLRELNIDDDFDTAESDLRRLIPRMAQQSRDWKAAAAAFQNVWGFPLNAFATTEADLRVLAAILESGVSSPQAVATALSPNAARQLAQVARQGVKALEAEQEVSRRYGLAFMSLDTDALASQWRQICQMWFLPRFFARRYFLRSLPVSATSINARNAEQMLREVGNARREASAFRSNQPRLAKALGDDYTDPARALEILDAFASCGDSCGDRLSGQLPAASAISSALKTIDRDKAAATLAALLPQATAMEQAAAELRRHCTKIPESLGDAAEQWAGHMDRLREWVIWRKHSRQAAELTLREPDMANGADACAARTAKGAYQAMAQAIIDGEPELSLFASEVFDQTIATYRRLSREFQELSKQALYCKVAARMPSLTMAAHESSELGILRRAIRSGGRGKSIRSLIDSIPTLLPRLCPVMLMSPLSVAQYLSLEGEKADVVIFDEASQMPTPEAVGAIARGRSVIVVGDPMQMPPTSFFTTHAVGDEEAHIDDMESILDDCIALSMPSLHLTWHYRSRHESLIAFSNQAYYDGRLTTFPSADNLSSHVSLRMITGVYDRSGSRSNRAEAEAVADEVVRRLQLPKPERLSIGVVAFSKAQQDLIDNILSARLAKTPELEDIAYNSPEPLFIKNLENVQGDERDVILFSVGYGPDSKGRVSMNFGPLNIAGGERRLNVAVSRSRREMVVFSSLAPEQIDLRRSGAKGVAGLKQFLEYAARGGALPMSGKPERADSVQQQVLDMVRSLGYEADTLVGASDFRVDVAVRDPRHQGRYLLAILCDGPRYRDAKTARDRERVQPHMLRSLGWHELRLWTPELMRSPQAALRRIEQALADALADSDESEEDTPDTPVSPESSDSPDSREARESRDPREPRDDREDRDASVAAQSVVASPARAALPERYPTAIYPHEMQLQSTNDLIRVVPQLQAFQRSVVESEQPITTLLLHKRTARAFGFSRITAKMERTLDNALHRAGLYVQNVGDVEAWWTSAEAADAYTGFRENGGRDITEMPPVEIDNAMLYVLSQQIGIEPDALMLLTAQILGYTRRGPNITAAMTAALQRLCATGRAHSDGTKVSFPARL